MPFLQALISSFTYSCPCLRTRLLGLLRRRSTRTTTFMTRPSPRRRLVYLIEPAVFSSAHAIFIVRISDDAQSSNIRVTYLRIYQFCSLLTVQGQEQEEQAKIPVEGARA